MCLIWRRSYFCGRRLFRFLIVAQYLIQYCPFCGNHAPASKRDSLFAKMTSDEFDRIQSLIAGLQTIDEVIVKFSEPDEDIANGSFRRFPETDNQPPVVQAFHQLTYRKFSPTVDVMISVHPSGLVEFGFSGKLLPQQLQ